MIWGELCIDKLNVQKREKETGSRYILEASAPAPATVYLICNMSPAHIQL
jgi:hypothetical protein